MSSQSELDIRWPIGLLFLLMGALIAIFGVVAPQSTHLEGAINFNLNLDWGLVMMAFGAFMLWGARRAGRRTDEAKPTDQHEAAHPRS